MYLVDTSVWIDYINGIDTEHVAFLDDLLSNPLAIGLNSQIYMEILQGSKNKKTCFFTVVIAKAMFAFLKTYIIQGNILRGWVGFALAVNSANKRYYKYIKQFINCQEEKKSS